MCVPFVGTKKRQQSLSEVKQQETGKHGLGHRSWMGSQVKEGPDTQHPPGREDGPDRRERPNPPRAPTRERKEPREAFKGRILSQKACLPGLWG